MKITHVYGACEIIESKGVKILFDPWLIDGEYYGSWASYPTVKDLDFGILDDIDYIYISHIHPDHFSRLTLSKIDKSIPILIHKFPAPFLKNNIERLGFSVTEIEANEKFYLNESLHINIIPAGFCNPEMCHKSFGCGKMETNYVSSVIDSLCVVSDGTHTVMNVNDCPYPVAKFAIEKAIEEYDIDFLMVGYTGASAYPQCFTNYSNEEKIEKAAGQKEYYFQSGLNYVNDIKPKFFMPMAGTYCLAGKLVELEKYRAVNDIKETCDRYTSLNEGSSRGILLNSLQSFDLSSETQTKPYRHFTSEEKSNYYENTLSKVKFDFESNEEPSLEELKSLCATSYKRFEDKRKELGMSSPTEIYVAIGTSKYAKFTFDNENLEFVSNIDSSKPFISFTVDPKLLSLLLRGPRYAHWNNAEIGCHITFHRQPDLYERGIHYCMNYFHQ